MIGDEGMSKTGKREIVEHFLEIVCVFPLSVKGKFGLHIALAELGPSDYNLNFNLIFLYIKESY